MTRGAIATIEDAVGAMRARVRPVGVETIPLESAAGRVLAQRVALDRPSPACDVSAMDGYAVQKLDCAGRALRVVGEIAPGRPASAMPDDGALRIFTGGVVPDGAAAVIPRELVDERDDSIVPHPGASIRAGMHIRRRGENGEAGAIVCDRGVPVGPAQLSAIASCGVSRVRVHRRVRLGVLVTGDEALPPDATPEAWQLRDSNGPALLAMFAPIPWIERVELERIGDDRAGIMDAIAAMLERSDAIVLTGGVSVGDHDYVPGALRELGVEIVFHRLAIRPGKPALGAAGGDGKPVLGLPGNPVSVMVTAELLAMPAIAARAGITTRQPGAWVDADGDRRAPDSLWWHPLVTVDGSGVARLVQSRGSGDWVSAAGSDGFIEVPPGQRIAGRRRYFPWDC